MTAKHDIVIIRSILSCVYRTEKAGMELYRDNLSVTPGLHPARRPPTNNFYSNRDRVGGSSNFPGFEHGGGPQNSGSDPMLGFKIDQMMDMLSSTQRLLMTQKDTCNRLEDTVTKLSSDVAAIQQEMSPEIATKKNNSEDFKS